MTNTNQTIAKDYMKTSILVVKIQIHNFCFITQFENVLSYKYMVYDMVSLLLLYVQA